MKTFRDLTTEQQTNLFTQVKGLKTSGLGYKKIIKKLITEQQIRLSQGTLSYWFNNEVKLLGGENTFEPKSSPELAYILGVMFGDASKFNYKKKQDYFLALGVKDKDFAEKFSQCGAKIVGKQKPFAVTELSPPGFSKMYYTRIRGKKLFNFVKEIKEDFEKAKPFIEEFPAEFIRGLADSEGSAIGCSSSGKLNFKVDVANSANLKLLEYTQDLLLKKYGIESSLRKSKTAGVQDSIINGRIITRTKDLFLLQVRKFKSIVKYSEFIDFTIFRKKQKLLDGIFLLSSFTRKEAFRIWQNFMKRKKLFGWQKLKNK